jgi:hypothetical protein
LPGLAVSRGAEPDNERQRHSAGNKPHRGVARRIDQRRFARSDGHPPEYGIGRKGDHRQGGEENEAQGQGFRTEMAVESPP